MSTGRPLRSVVAALTGLALAGVMTSHPASADTAPAIPERLVTPDPDLPTLSETGPIGPLAVVFGAAQAAENTSGLRSGLVGVSATTGEYRFIDLPDRAYAENGGVDFIELSPRGRRIAYRIGGPERVNGFAALDTVTGKVTTRRVPSRFGLSARLITWVSEQTLLVRYAKSQRSEQGGLEPGRARYYRWTPGVSLRPIRCPDSIKVTWQRDGVLNTQVNPNRTRAVGHVGAGPALHVVVADSLRPPTPARRLRVGIPVWLILRWADEDHLLLRAGRRPDRVGVYRVNVNTAAKKLLVRETVARYHPPPRYASALWDRPPVPRPFPETATDQRQDSNSQTTTRLVLIAGSATLLLLVAASRRHRRGASRSTSS